jgi:hypothetical protein
MLFPARRGSGGGGKARQVYTISADGLPQGCRLAEASANDHAGIGGARAKSGKQHRQDSHRGVTGAQFVRAKRCL